MRIQLLHTLVVGAVAALAAWIGLSFVLPSVDGERWLLPLTITASVFIWLLFGNLYLHSNRSALSALFFGLLSPFLGCLLVYPPYSFFFVFRVTVESVGLGVGTSLVVWACSRLLATRLVG